MSNSTANRSSVAEAFDALARQVSQATYDYIGEYFRQREALFTPDLADGSLSYLKNTGKCLRPLLLVLSARMAGNPSEELLWPACGAVESFHNGTLVHDDIIDQDSLRRGVPTAHCRVADASAQRHPQMPEECRRHFGISTAILGGALLYSHASQMLCQLPESCPEKVRLSLLAHFNGVLAPGLMLGEQQDVELEWKSLSQVTTAQIQEMVYRKTSLLLECAALCGGAIGAGVTIDKAHIGKCIAQAMGKAGIAFQIQDDILGMFGTQERLGKPIGSDVREGKRTMLVTLAWQNSSENARRHLEMTLGNATAKDSDVVLVNEIVTQSGALRICQEQAEELIQDAHRIIQSELEGHPDYPLLLEYLRRLTRRNR